MGSGRCSGGGTTTATTSSSGSTATAAFSPCSSPSSAAAAAATASTTASSSSTTPLAGRRRRRSWYLLLLRVGSRLLSTRARSRDGEHARVRFAQDLGLGLDGRKGSRSRCGRLLRLQMRRDKDRTGTRKLTGGALNRHAKRGRVRRSASPWWWWCWCRRRLLLVREPESLLHRLPVLIEDGSLGGGETVAESAGRIALLLLLLLRRIRSRLCSLAHRG
jgi:hypothetical protein